MRKLYTMLVALLCFAASAFSQSGIFESYAILDINGGGNTYYDMQATTANPDLQGANLGNFNSSNSLVVKGGQNKTFKCAPCDITNGNLYYRVWLTSGGPSGSFININEPFLANLGTGCGGNDQSWEGTSGATNILTGLTPGKYTLEVYSASDYQGCGTGTHFSNNGGANYRATFTFCGPTSGPLPAGNYAIPGCFANVAAAVNYINTNGVSGTGNVQFDVAAGYTETAPAGGFAITATGTSTLGIKFVKSGAGANPTFTAPTTHVAGTLTDAIFKLIGADYITIDGFTMLENAANTTTTAASNNMTEWGVALLYASLTNGAQNNTIQNCTITLNRTYLNTFGIYSNTRHSATAITTSAEVTAASGSNSNNRVYGNTISNVNYGIVFIGAGTTIAAIDNGNDIGGSSAATGNTITNWGGGGAASGYLSLTGNNYCIFMNQQNNDNVSYNTITSGALTQAVVAGGILKNYSIATPAAATVTNTTINNNTVTITNNPSATTAGAIIGINNQGISTFLSTATVSMNNNTVQNCVLGGSTSTTNGITGITNLSLAGTVNMNANSVLNNSITATTATSPVVVGISNSGGAGTLNITGNTVRGFSIAAGSAAGYLGISNSGACSVAINISNNKLGDATANALTVSVATSGVCNAIQNSAGASTSTLAINGNEVKGLTFVSAGSVSGILSTSGFVGGAISMSNNKIGTTDGGFVSYSAANSSGVNGIINQGGSAATALTMTGNDIRGITHTTAGSSAHTYLSNTFAGLSQNISNNTFTNLNVNTTGNVTFISNSISAQASGFKTVNNNSIVTAFNKGGAGGTVALYSDGGSSTTGTTVQNNNNNFSNITVTGGTAITGWFNNDGTGATPAKTITGNVFNNWTCGTGTVSVLQSNFGSPGAITGNTVTNITGQGAITGIFVGSSGTYATGMNLSTNTVTGLSSTGSGGVVTGISVASPAPSSGTNSVSSNIINNLSSTSTTATVAGISSSASTTNLSGNTINTLTCTGTTSGVTNGIMVTGGTTVNLFKNRIYDLQTTGAFTTTPGVNGIVLSGSASASTYTVYNNMIGDLKAPAASSTDAIRGISVTATGTTATYNVYFNTVNISASSSGANFGTSGIFHATNATATTGALNLRNNIIVNTSTPAGTGLTAAYRRSSTTLTNYASTSNNNLFYGGTPGAANLLFTDGTNNDQTLTAYKTRVAPRDGASVTENPPFLSTSGASANFLHIDPAVATQVESGAASIAGITDDYDGDTRNVSTPDIGADEGTFILADVSGPGIAYTPLGNTACPSDVTLSPVTITDASGVDIAAGTRPRMYYKKSTNANTYVDNTNATDGWKYVEATGIGGSPFSFTTNYSLLFGGAPVAGDSLSYFIVAQDLAGTPNVGINSGTFAAAPTSVALTAAAFPLTGVVNGYRIIAAGLSGTVTIGAAGTYPNLTGAGGLFNAINTQGMSSSVTANILDASVTEPGTVALNAINYNGCAAGPYPLLIKPDAGVTTVLTGSVGTGSVIKLNGADFVTFDGSNNGTGSRNMTLQNTTTTTSGNAVVWLASPALGNGSVNDTIKNCIIEGNSATTSFTGVHIGGSTTIGITTAGNERNSNNAVTNNLFRKTQYGVIMYGISAVSPDQNNIINNNSFGTAVAGEGFSLLAINVERQQNMTVSGNEVQNVTNATNVSSTPFGGIRLIDFKDGLCYRNNVHDLAYTNTSTSKIYGIAITSSSYNSAGNASNSRIYNNMVSRITSTGTSSVWNTTGILASAGYGDKFYYNTVNLNGQVANSSSGLAAAFANGDGNITTVCTNIDVRDNIFSLTGSNATAGGNFWAYYSAATSLAGSTLNYNNLYCNGTGATNNVGRFNGTSYTTLASWQTATAQEANSVIIAPVFVSNSDAHLVPGSNATLDNLGTPIAGITDDIDGDVRNATTPDMGADEFTAPTCTVAVGGTASGSASGCTSYAGNITATGYSTGIGSTYQWVSATNPAGPWTAISGATNPATYTISPAVTVNTYYKLAVACATGASVDSSTVVTITINSKPTVPVSPGGPVTLCAPATQILDATGTNAAAPTFQWLNNNLPISGATSGTYTATTTGSYRVRIVNTVTTCFDTSVAVVVTVNPQPTAPTVTPAAPVICAGNVQLLTASGSVLNGTADLGTGTSVTTASTTTSTLGPNPLESYYGGAKQQMIVLASELTGLGLTNGSVISALAFNMNAVEARTLQNYTVKVSNTALNAFSSLTFEPAGTVVRNPANFTPAAGWNTITFDNNYTWNGTSNLLIEVNFSNNDAGGTGTNTAIYSTTGFASTLFYRVDNNTAAAVDAATTASFTAYTQRNNMRFIFATPVNTYEWLPATGLYSDAAGTVPYVAGTYTPTVYASPAVTTNYTAKSLSVSCENTTPFTVTVTNPTSPNGLAGTPTPGATLEWSETHSVNNGQHYVESATCNLINKVIPSGASPVSGSIFSAVRVDSGANKMGSGELYAARFYAIEPAVAPSTSTARVTLYYLQSEFDNYNLKAVDSAKYALPTGPGDALGISRLVIRQFHGTPTGGYLPGNYAGANEILDPADADVVWNAAASRWEVTVPVSSFSGFWLTSVDFIVPVRLLNIRGEVTGNTNTIYWTTSQEQNNRKFIIERSTDGRNFTAIGETASRALNGTSSAPLGYSFVDAAPVNGKSYYRLQMVSMNGGTEQSPVVTLLRGKGSFEIVDVRPNPATSMVYFNVIGSNSAITVVVRSLEGKEVARTSLSQSNAFSINIGGLANGMYMLEATDRNGAKATYKIVKQ